MTYKIHYSLKALKDLAILAKNEPSAYKKAAKFIEELKLHPTTGTGKPEPLKGDPKNLGVAALPVSIVSSTASSKQMSISTSSLLMDIMKINNL